MKICPHCRAHYPTHFYVCPQDGKPLDSVSGFPTGTVIRGKYEILEKLGQGGMGTVYKARHLVFNETCALKIVSEQLAQDEQFLERFRSEAVIMRRLNHPNAVHVIDVDKTEDDHPFIVMEYVKGENLRELLAKRGALPVPEALEIAHQVCSALTGAHELNVLHRDIKPENILVVSLTEGNPLVKVADFGVAKIKESTLQYSLHGGAATRAGVVLGTPAYMSPEQAMGKPGSQLDVRSDLYSLGVVLYEMLTGSQPFTAETPMALLVQHMQTAPRPPQEIAPQHKIPIPVSALVMKALKKDPADRFSTAVEMQVALTATGEVSTDASTMPHDPRAPAPVIMPTSVLNRTESQTEAVRWGRKAADSGSTWVKKHLGNAYNKGRGIAKNKGEGVRWFRKSAKKMSVDTPTVPYNPGAPAQVITPPPVPKQINPQAKAVRWDRKVIDSGTIWAKKYLGKPYNRVRWFRKAAGEVNTSTPAVPHDPGTSAQVVTPTPVSKRTNPQVETVPWYGKFIHWLLKAIGWIR